MSDTWTPRDPMDTWMSDLGDHSSKSPTMTDENELFQRGKQGSYKLTSETFGVRHIAWISDPAAVHEYLAQLTPDYLGVAFTADLLSPAETLGPMVTIAQHNSIEVAAVSLSAAVLALLTPLLRQRSRQANCGITVDGIRLERLAHSVNDARTEHRAMHCNGIPVSAMIDWLLPADSSNDDPAGVDEAYQTMLTQLNSISTLIGFMSGQQKQRLSLFSDAEHLLKASTLDAVLMSVPPSQRNVLSIDDWSGIVLEKGLSNKWSSTRSEVSKSECSDVSDKYLMNQLMALIDSANAPIFGVDLNMRIDEWNHKSEELTGYSKEEVLGTLLVDAYVADEYKELVEATLASTVSGADQLSTYEFTVKSRSGKQVNMLLNATARRDGDGEIKGVMCIGQSISAEKMRTERTMIAIATEMLNLIDTANAPIFGVDASLRINEWNQKAAELTGYSKKEVLGQLLVDEFITDEYKSPVRAVLQSAVTGGEQSALYEFPLFTKTGKRLELLLNATTRRDADGKIKGVLGVGQDITEKVRAEKEQTSIATEMLNLIDTANAPIIGVDTSLMINEWNQKAAELTGYSKQDVLGKNLTEYITNGYRSEITDILISALQGRAQDASFEFPMEAFSIAAPNGIQIELLMNATTRRDSDGKIKGVLGIGIDMTKERGVQRQLDRSQVEKIAVWGCIREGIATVEGTNVLDGTLLEVNSAMCDICGGATEDELRGTTLRQHMPLQSQERLKHLDLVAGSGELIIEFELAGVGDTVKQCEATFMEMPHDGLSVRMALVVRDRTWKKELERQATELMLRAERVRTLNKQLKWVQHQVKNSALALDFRLQQVMQVMAKEQVYAVVDGVEAEFKGLQKEITDLMESLERHVMLGELAAGTYIPRFEEHDPAFILGKTFRNCTDLDESEMFRARFDVHALHHASSNLESNAEKYCADGSPVRKVSHAFCFVQSHPPVSQAIVMYTSQALVPAPAIGDSVVVEGQQIGDSVNSASDKSLPALGLIYVSCTNQLDPADCKKLGDLHRAGELASLFKEGVRAAGERHAAKSAGDGLALTKSVIESLQGSLWVHLDEDCQTICFNVTVPLLLPIVSNSELFRSGVGVMAVDDCATQRMMLQVYLKKLGVPYKVLGADPDHYTNICKYAKEFVDQNDGVQLMVILDQHLSEEPVIMGIDLADQLTAKFSKRELFTFIRSGNTMTDDIKLYLKHADGFLEKNDSFTTLRSKLLTQLMLRTELDNGSQGPTAQSMTIEDMEVQAIRVFKESITKAIEKWMHEESGVHLGNWDISQAELHLIKGGIKGLVGMLSEDPPPDFHILSAVTTQIDLVRKNIGSTEGDERRILLSLLTEPMVSLILWFQNNIA